MNMVSCEKLSVSSDFLNAYHPVDTSFSSPSVKVRRPLNVVRAYYGPELRSWVIEVAIAVPVTIRRVILLMEQSATASQQI